MPDSVAASKVTRNHRIRGSTVGNRPRPVMTAS
jgi:hypothetical protein